MNRSTSLALVVLLALTCTPVLAYAEDTPTPSTAFLEFHGEAEPQLQLGRSVVAMGGAVDLEVATPNCCALGAYVAARALEEPAAKDTGEERRLLDGGAQLTVPSWSWLLFRLRAGKAGTQPLQLDSGRTGYVLGAAAMLRVTHIDIFGRGQPLPGQFAPVMDLVVSFSQVKLSALRNSNDKEELHAQYFGVALRLGVEYGLSLGQAATPKK